MEATTNSAIAVLRIAPQRSLLERTAWMWPDFIARRRRLAAVLWCLVPAGILYAIITLFAVFTDNLPRALSDTSLLVWPAMLVISATALAHLPRIAERVAPSLRPWLADPDNPDVQKAMEPGWLLGLYWWFAIPMFCMVFSFAFQNPMETPLRTYTNPEVMRWYIVPWAVLAGFFVGGALSMATLGLTLYARRLQQTLRFKADTLTAGGKSALRPVNDLITKTWLLFTLPFLFLGTVSQLTNTPGEYSSKYLFASVVFAAAIYSVLLLTIVVPHVFLNRLLAKQKLEEIKELRSALNAAAQPRASEEPAQAVQRLIQHQHLSAQFQQLQAVTPTLIDAKFFIQVATSMTGILIANILLRTIISKVIGA